MFHRALPLLRRGFYSVLKNENVGHYRSKTLLPCNNYFTNKQSCYHVTKSLNDDIGFLTRDSVNNYDFEDSEEDHPKNFNRMSGNNKFEFAEGDYSRPMGFKSRDNSNFWLDGLDITKYQKNNEKELRPFVKNVYDVTENDYETDNDNVTEYLKTHNIKILGQHVKPVMTFEKKLFHDSIYEVFQKLQYEDPSPIQAVSWPQCLSGSNVVGIAQTGSGKTLAFVAPAIQHVLKNRKYNLPGPRVVILCPTRELAMQCHSVVKDFSHLGITNACIYGGASKSMQARQLTDKLDILVATPGRMLDFLNSGDLCVNDTTYFVLDEADRMLDMGFKPQIDAISCQMRPDRQVVMWSATWPEEIQDLAHAILGNDFVHIKIGTGELTPCKTVSHYFRPANSLKAKQEGLMKILQDVSKQEPNSKIIIFCETKVQCDRIFRYLHSQGSRSHVAIHGDKTQASRTNSLRNFRNNPNCNLLIATSVAARGLDIPEVKFVINFDMPKFAEEYVHRIGRSGRNGRKGYAITFISSFDMQLPSFPKIIRSLKELIVNGGQTPPPDLDAMLQACKVNKSKYEKSMRYTKTRF